MNNDRSNNEKKKGKVIPFPKLGERLLEKGMDALQEKNYRLALESFEQLKGIDAEYPQAQAGIVIALLELGYLEEAREESERLLKEGIGDYYNNLQVYVTVLIQMNDYGKAAETIQAVLQEEKVPPELGQHFYQLLDFCQRMESQVDRPPIVTERNRDLEESLLSGQPQQQIKALQELRSTDIRPYTNVLNGLLENEAGAPELKTMVLEVLMEKRMDIPIKVTKFGQTKEVVPSQLKGVFDDPFAIQVLNLLDEKLGNENPTLFQIVKELWHRHVFITFPFEPSPPIVDIWAAALYKIGYDMHGIHLTETEAAEEYGVDVDEMISVFDKLMKVEKEAFGNMMF